MKPGESYRTRLSQRPDTVEMVEVAEPITRAMIPLEAYAWIHQDHPMWRVFFRQLTHEEGPSGEGP